MNTKKIGDKTVAFILYKLIERGKTVLLPFGDNERYDLLLDENGKFIRLQCKTGKLKDGVITFKTCSSSVHRNGIRKPYLGEVEFFAVACEGKAYLIPVDKVGINEGSLRLEPTKNRQKKYVRWAADYEL